MGQGKVLQKKAEALRQLRFPADEAKLDRADRVVTRTQLPRAKAEGLNGSRKEGRERHLHLEILQEQQQAVKNTTTTALLVAATTSTTTLMIISLAATFEVGRSEGGKRTRERRRDCREKDTQQHFK